MSCSVTGMVAGLKRCAFELADEHEWNHRLYISPATLAN